MIITWTNEQGVEVNCKQPHVDCFYVVVDDAEHEDRGCPHCGIKESRIATFNVEQDNVKAWGRAGCYECKAERGTLVVELDTLFGREEDERVSRSGAKVF